MGEEGADKGALGGGGSRLEQGFGKRREEVGGGGGGFYRRWDCLNRGGEDRNGQLSRHDLCGLH